MKKSFNVLDLFCGAGGLSCGFEQAGFKILLGIDNDKMALETFENNHQGTKILNGDITAISYQKDILPLIGNQKIDVIIGGPPCQGFSIAGKRFIDDPRNQLYKGFVNLVDKLRPALFVMENVPNLISLGNGQIKDNIVSNFKAINYFVTYAVLTASDFGVPQQRRRVFFVGINKDKVLNCNTFNFPKAIYGENKKSYITTEEAISDLDFLTDKNIGTSPCSYFSAPQSDYQREMRKNCKSLYNHTSTVHTERVKKIIHMVPDGENYKSLPIEYQNTRKVHIAWTRMNSKKPCFTIDTGHNHHFHYRADRVPTPREVARIQSFPDKYIFYGTRTAQLKQIGNAVPPLLAKALAIQIRDFMEKHYVRPY